MKYQIGDRFICIKSVGYFIKFARCVIIDESDTQYKIKPENVDLGTSGWFQPKQIPQYFKEDIRHQRKMKLDEIQNSNNR